MKYFKILLSLLILACVQTAVHASVNEVTYKIVYNSTTCLYDVLMTITNGSTTSIQDQEAYTAQVTIVVPTGTAVGTTSIVSNEPKLSSYSGGVLTRSSTAKAWTNSNTEVNHASLPGYDAYSFTPNLTNAYYGSLSTNDVVLLFSIHIATSSCGSGIRLWNNNEIQGAPVTGGDPTSANFGGLDYNNGHDFSSTSSLYQAYVGNGTSIVAPPLPSLTLTPTHIPGVSFADTSAAAVGSICSGSSLTYAWVGPNSFSSSTPSIYVAPLVSASYGTYTLTVTDSLGCSRSESSTINQPVALPVKLTSFNGDANKCTAVLNWETASEVNAKHFEIQFSIDGNLYTTIGQVSSKNQHSGSRYTYTHNQENQKGYYRLKIMDLDGNYTFSKIVSVTTSCDNSMITVAPNPTSGIIKIAGIRAGDQIKVMNMVGQLVRSITSASNAETIDLSPYAAGVYQVLVVQNQIITKTEQVVKKIKFPLTNPYSRLANK